MSYAKKPSSQKLAEKVRQFLDTKLSDIPGLEALQKDDDAAQDLLDLTGYHIMKPDVFCKHIGRNVSKAIGEESVGMVENPSAVTVGDFLWNTLKEHDLNVANEATFYDVQARLKKDSPHALLDYVKRRIYADADLEYDDEMKQEAHQHLDFLIGLSNLAAGKAVSQSQKKAIAIHARDYSEAIDHFKRNIDKAKAQQKSPDKLEQMAVNSSSMEGLIVKSLCEYAFRDVPITEPVIINAPAEFQEEWLRIANELKMHSQQTTGEIDEVVRENFVKSLTDSTRPYLQTLAEQQPVTADGYAKAHAELAHEIAHQTTALAKSQFIASGLNDIQAAIGHPKRAGGRGA